MKIFDRLMQSMRGSAGTDTVQMFYANIARSTPNGGPSYNESKRDYARVRTDTQRYMLF